MIEQLVTRFEAARLGLHQRELRRREEAAIARLGERTLVDGAGHTGRLASLSSDAAAIRRRLATVAEEHGASSVARERRTSLEHRLAQIHLTAGRLALALPPTGAESEVLAIRAELANAVHEQDRLRGEGRRLADETWSRIHGWVAPRGPALAAFAVGWLVARGYAVSHTKGILAALGLSAARKGSHWVSLSFDTGLVQYVLPLLVAALGAFLAHRLTRRVREAVDVVRARSPEPPRAAGEGRAAAGVDKTPARRDMNSPR